MKTCNKCKEESDNFQAGRGTCRLCRNKDAIARRTGASNDASEHDYGKEPLPPGFVLSGVSQMVDAKGNVKVQWLKSKADKAAQSAILMAALEEMAKGFKGIVKPTKKPQSNASDLLTVVPMGDPHIGLHCWNEETGNDFDLKIAADNMRTAFGELFAAGPDTKECLIINLGDYFHADNSANTTTKGTPVDVDGRRVKVVRVGLEIFVDIILQALAKYEIVNVICATGNHDADSSKMLAMMLDIMFTNEPRVKINTDPTKFHKFRFGKCLIGVTHGDTGKASELPMIMATDWKDDWAASEYRQWYCGHVHHDTRKEYTGRVIVETFRTLAPADAWHTASGYRSGQDIKLDVWHKEYGHVQRNTVGIRQVLDKL